MRKLEDICGKETAEKVRANDPSLIKLVLRGGRPVPNINDKNMEGIIESLKENTFISKLVLAENDISDQGLNGIGVLKHITYLDLSNNDLSDGCLDKLSEMEQLTFLDLGGSNNLSGKFL